MGGRKIEWKNAFALKETKIRMGKCIESGGGELHTRLEISKGRGWWKRLLQWCFLQSQGIVGLHDENPYENHTLKKCIVKYSWNQHPNYDDFIQFFFGLVGCIYHIGWYRIIMMFSRK